MSSIRYSDLKGNSHFEQLKLFNSLAINFVNLENSIKITVNNNEKTLLVEYNRPPKHNIIEYICKGSGMLDNISQGTGCSVFVTSDKSCTLTKFDIKLNSKISQMFMSLNKDLYFINKIFIVLEKEILNG